VSYIDESCTGDRSFGIIEQGSGDMISSMTGYGEASREADGMVFTVEIRSVNNRYYKSHLRLPDPAAFLEGELEKILRDQVARGTVGYSLHMKNLSGPAQFDIDEGVIQAICGGWKASASPARFPARSIWRDCCRCRAWCSRSSRRTNGSNGCAGW
jgi:hypothetical protein